MRSFQDHGDFARREAVERMRLDTPRSSGYRRGMTSTGVIARKLETIYDLPASTPSEIERALDAIDRSLNKGK